MKSERDETHHTHRIRVVDPTNAVFESTRVKPWWDGKRHKGAEAESCRKVAEQVRQEALKAFNRREGSARY